MRASRYVENLLSVVVIAAIAGCGGEHDHKDHDHTDHVHKDESKGGGHTHEAKFGGALIGLGEHKAHVELKIDDATMKFMLWVWDGEVEKAIRIKQPAVVIQIEGGPLLTLTAHADENTGETVGDSSTFSCALDQLGGKTKFDAVIKSIAVKGETYTDSHFNYPLGAEEKGR